MFVNQFDEKSAFFQSLNFHSLQYNARIDFALVNPFAPNAAFLYSLKTVF